MVTFIQSPAAGGGQSLLYAGGVFNLKAGDTIYLKPVPSPKGRFKRNPGPSPEGPANLKPVGRPGPKAYFGAFYI